MERSPAIIRYIVFIQYDDAFKITFNMNTEFRLSKSQAVLQRRQQYSINNTRASHKQREPSFMSKSRRSNFGHWVPGKMTHSKIAAKPMTAKALHRAKLCQSDEAMTKHWRFRGHDAAKDPSAEEEAWRAWTHQVSAYQTQIGWDFYRCSECHAASVAWPGSQVPSLTSFAWAQLQAQKCKALLNPNVGWLVRYG